MKKRYWNILVWVLLCLCLLQGCIQLPDEPSPDESEDESHMNETILHYYPDAVYVYSSDVDVDLLLTGMSPTYLLLANKVCVLGEDYAPASLKTLTCPTNNGKTVQLESRAADAVCAMMEEMRADGVTNVSVTSGYRDYAYQNSLFNYYCQVEMNSITADARNYFGDEYLQSYYYDLGKTKLDYEDARKVVLSYSALPGTSEHETGLCVDFITSDMSGLTNAFEDTAAFAWLSENAYKFGFILRYPADKTEITGISYEPWHIRYVGAPHATVIMDSGLTLEEYIDLLQPNIWYASGEYLISRRLPDAIDLPDGWSHCDISPDNTGYYIVTLHF